MVKKGTKFEDLPKGVTDSKKLNEKQRDAVYDAIVNCPHISYKIVEKSHERIDEINILQASLEGMHDAALSLTPTHVYVDGNHLPPKFGYSDANAKWEAVIKGDAKVFSIAAASVLAKVHRDRIMDDLDKQFPVYGFAEHKGYPVPKHRDALDTHGPCPFHRTCYTPVMEALWKHDPERAQKIQEEREAREAEKMEEKKPKEEPKKKKEDLKNNRSITDFFKKKK